MIILSHSLKGFSFIFFSKFLYFGFNYCNLVGSVSSFINVTIVFTSHFVVTINQPIVEWLLSLMILLFYSSTFLPMFPLLSNYLFVFIIIFLLQFFCSFNSHLLFLVHKLKFNWINHVIKFFIIFD